ncbi:MAG: M20/M25/M40 family metallo-hydrolase, partial [Desulfurococcales archaeon]|nr:M20/M25/M40 family metallo-hydrolase [Desulfurococcales archaeon]
MLNCVDILKELISVRSLSGREGETASLIKDYLSTAGVDKVFFDRLGNVIAEIKGGGSGVVVLEGHMDVVDPGDLSSWRSDPFTATVINDRIYGRGAVDMKGAIAAQIQAISMFKEFDVDVYAVYTTHEETAEGVAFKHAITEGIGRRPDVVVI